MMAPPLAGSPRVQGHRDYVIKVLLGGLTGPLDGRTYSEVMAPLGSAPSDEWVAGVASFVRSSFGNTGSLVTPADVARVRASMKARKTMWTVGGARGVAAEADRSEWHGRSRPATGGDTAAGAATLRGWNSGAPQAAGMWLTVALPQPAAVTELQFDSDRVAQPRARRRSRRDARRRVSARVFGAGVASTARPGASRWRPARAGAAHDDRVLADAREVRPNHADRQRSADAPPWSVSNLRILSGAVGAVAVRVPGRGVAHSSSSAAFRANVA